MTGADSAHPGRPRSASAPISFPAQPWLRFHLVARQGAMAQLVARFHGMEEATGSNPVSSTRRGRGPSARDGPLFVCQSCGGRTPAPPAGGWPPDPLGGCVSRPSVWVTPHVTELPLATTFADGPCDPPWRVGRKLIARDFPTASTSPHQRTSSRNNRSQHDGSCQAKPASRRASQRVWPQTSASSTSGSFT